MKTSACQHSSPSPRSAKLPLRSGVRVAVSIFLFAVVISAAAVETNMLPPTDLPTRIPHTQTTNSSLIQKPPEPVMHDTIEVEHLKAKLQMLKEFQSDILQTVYWSLGAVFAIAVLLVGYNWISANKIYDRDKQALKQDVINSQKGMQAEFEARINSTITSSLAAGEGKYLEFSREVSDKLSSGLMTVEEKYLALRDDTGKNLQLFRAELDEQLRTFIKTSLNDLESRLKSQADTTATELAQKISKLKQNLYIVEFHLNENLGKDHEKNKSWSVAYSYYFRALIAAVELGWEFHITPSFNNVIRCLSNGAQLLQHEKSNAEKLITKLPEQCKVQGDAWIELVKKAPLYK